jgi:glycosyltransferase involved in cell wall biosynthesis
LQDLFYLKLKKIFFTVTNDLSYDQRMQRICHSLAEKGYAVTLVGRKLPGSLQLEKKTFRQKRIRCMFKRGKLFYAEYNFRLFYYLLFRKMDAVCAIDLDTIFTCYYIARIKKIPRVYDAHELFTELKEVITRPPIHKAWLRVEKKFVPRFTKGYTVSTGIAEEFRNRYGVNYETILNVPLLNQEALYSANPGEKTKGYILYQGAVNEARGFEWLVPAMEKIDSKLVICGDGNFMPQLKNLIAQYQLGNKIECRGMLRPGELSDVSRQARLGLCLSEKQGLNQWLALPNKFFDYIHAGLPQVAMNFPEYKKINDEFEVALLIGDLETETLAGAINHLLADESLHTRLHQNCLKAKEKYNWQNEEVKLIDFYKKLFAP